MNILITGVLGHIGSSLLENIYKIKNLKKVYLIDSARSNNLNVLFNLKKSKIKFIFISKFVFLSIIFLLALTAL